MEQKENWTICKYITENGDIIEFPNYMVSDQGRVKSLNYRGTGKEAVMSPHAIVYKDGTIIYQVGLIKHKGDKQMMLSVHRLVLSSFDPEGWKPKYVVNHKKERTSATCINALSNLEWCTVQQNNSTEHCKALRSKAFTNRKDLSKRVRVTFPDRTQKIFPSAKEAGRSLGISPKMVSTLIKQHNGHYKKMNLYFEYI